jgi:hypothetical protein
MYRLSLDIDHLPKALNKSLRTHYHQLNKEKKRWHELIILLTLRNRPASPLPKANLKITRHYYRSLDYDGLVGSLKPVVDGLIHAQIIKDDSWGVLGAWEVDQQFRPKKHGPLLEIEVTEVIP